MICSLIFLALGLSRGQSDVLVVPGYTAYGAPDHDKLRVSSTGTGSWTSTNQTIQWHGMLNDGDLTPTINVYLPEGQTAHMRIFVGPQQAVDRSIGENSGGFVTFAQESQAVVTGQGDQMVSVTFPGVTIAQPGYETICLQGTFASGGSLPDVESITLRGKAVAGAHFNMKERRNTASVHLHYPFAKDTQVAWF